MLSRPSDGDLPTGQGLEANGKPAADTIRDGQRPVTLARASEPLNRYLKLNVPDRHLKGDQLADDGSTRQLGGYLRNARHGCRGVTADRLTKNRRPSFRTR